jgi:teichuronic acid biosynthesis glycosyltransferase TuaH
MMRGVDASARTALSGQRVLLYCGGSSWDAPPGTDHHLATHLSQHLPVVYVDPAESLVSQARAGRTVAARSALEPVCDGLFRLRPRTLPGVTRPFLRELAALQTRKAIRRLAGELQLRVAAQVVACMDDVLLPELTGTRVLYGTDDFVAGADLMGISRDWVLRREPRQLATATHILTVSDIIAKRWAEAGRTVSVLPNGCDAAAFAGVPNTAPASELEIPAPRAIVVGQLSERLDLGLLEACAATGRSLLLVGPALSPDIDRRLRELSASPNVQWVGRVPFTALPGYLAASSVGLTPYVDDAFNRASFPLKTLEYLAAGLPVVSTDLPAARALRSAHVSLAEGRSEFVSAVLGRLDSPGDAADTRERQAFAADQSWSVRAERLLQLVGLSDPVATA